GRTLTLPTSTTGRSAGGSAATLTAAQAAAAASQVAQGRLRQELPRAGDGAAALMCWMRR
ncbi:MAG TPA: hypothetical protein VNH41_08220, partial [Steroidobacteraceae bacterium]|nr:hypothetical protein [Steroidobacteraceae bacterium]